jgi:outer membrane protein OmpA-like peptidoglycan-associated protein
MSHAFMFPLVRSGFARWFLALALVVYSAAVQAQPLVPDKPSVEVHLEVLRALKINSAPTSLTAPVAPVEVVAEDTPRNITQSDRKIPAEQPMLGQYEGVRQVPAPLPFARGQSPAVKWSEPPPAPPRKPAPVKKPVPKKKPVREVPPAPSVPSVSTATPEAEAELIKALEKETPPAAAAPAPLPEPKPAPAPVTASPAPAPTAKKEAPPVVLPAVDLPPLPETPAPAAPAPEIKKPVAAKPVVAELPELPPLPAPEKAAPAKVAPAVPPIPPLVPEALPPAKPAAKASPPEVMVIDKKSVAPLPDIPPLPPLPDPSSSPTKEVPLPPSVEKRMEKIFEKQPAQQGIVSDKTKLIVPVTPPKKEAGTEAKKEVKEEAALAAAKEAERKAQLDAKAQKAAEAAVSPLAALPAPATLPAAAPVVAPPPPAPTLPDKIELATTSNAELPPLPELPPLTPITGEGKGETSLAMAQPTEAVESKDLMAQKTGAALKPFDAPEALPKVTSGKKPESSTETLADVPATLPPPPVPAKAEKTQEPAAKSEPPSAPALPASGVAPETDKEPAKEESPANASETLHATILFDHDKMDLSEENKAKLKAIAQEIRKNKWQVRVVAYAAGTPEQSSFARRISLSRALQIRAYLIEQMVDESAINVIAMGNKKTSGNPNRADILVR